MWGKVSISLTFLCLFLTLGRCVREVSQADFDGSFWFVQLYSGSCPDCKAQEKELNNVGELLQGIAKVGKVNSNSIPGFKAKKNPSYFLIKGKLTDYVQYKQKFSKISISKFVISEMQKTVKDRHSKLFPEEKPEQPKQKEQKKPNAGSSSGLKKQNGVIVLSDKDFEQNVVGSDDAWFVEFYSPSCGHCRSLQPEYDKLPSKLGKRVNIAKIDATQNRQMAQKYQIKGFPTLLFFATDDKQTPVPYQSERTAEAMTTWLQSQKIGQEKLEFVKLTKETYAKECNRNIVCLVYIVDKKSQVRQDLSFIESVMEEHKGKPLRFFYSGRLDTFESKLMIEDRNTPKLVSIWDSINSYKIYNNEHSEESLNTYIGKIMERRTWIKMDEKIEKVLFAVANEEL